MKKHLELYDTFPVHFSVQDKNKKVILTDAKQGLKDGYTLICEVNATHSGTLINNRIYPPESMKRGVRTWTAPFKKPVLINHDDTRDAVGRVIAAKYETTPKGSSLSDSTKYEPILDESEGYGYQRLTVRITDPDAIQKVLDGRYETVSVRMSTDHSWCSICNEDWSDSGPCDHEPGRMYEDKLAYMTTGDLTYREVSFVNMPADEYAGVREAVFSNKKDIEAVGVYANSDSEKVLTDLNDGKNIYTFLDSETEADDLVSHLIDKSNTSKTNKEEDVNIQELTKDQLKDLEVVKSLVQESVDQAKQDAANECEKSKKECQDSLQAVQVELTALREKMDASTTTETETETVEQETSETTTEENGEEDAKKKKKKKMAEGMSEEACASDKETISDESSKTVEDLLDENVRINTELHKVYAERLYDLKKALRKPDVVGITTSDARQKKLDELAQRSVESIKDQIEDLLMEQNNAPLAGQSLKDLEISTISPSDITNEVIEDKKKLKEGKKEALSRLFPKSS